MTRAPSGRDLLVRYVLEHRTAIFAAGFLLLLDQVATDWLASRWAGGSEWLGSFGVPLSAVASAGVLALAAVLAFIGARGLRRSFARMRADGATGRTGYAIELFVLAGCLALVVNLFVRGTAAAPLVIVSLPAAMVLLFDVPQRGERRAARSPFSLGGRDHA